MHTKPSREKVCFKATFIQAIPPILCDKMRQKSVREKEVWGLLLKKQIGKNVREII